MAAAVIAAIYVEGVLERREFPSGGNDDPEITATEGVEFNATIWLVDENIEFDYQVTNQRDEPVAIVDPNQLGGGSPAEEGPESLWRDIALRETEPDLLELRNPGGGRFTSTDGFLLQPGESRSGHVMERAIVADPPEELELCVEVIEELGQSDEAESDDADEARDRSQIELPDRASGDPVAVACTGELPVQRSD